MTLKEFRDKVKESEVVSKEDYEKYYDHPDHYNRGGIECIDAMESAFGRESLISFCLLNAFKYIWRAREKESFVKDITKAIWYLEKILETEEYNGDETDPG